MIYEIISDKKCLLGESPIWHESTNNFIWLDYLKSKIFFYNTINKDITDMSKMIYEIISDKKCLLGESPIWHESTNNFIWLDYLKSKIFFYNPINKDIAEKK